ncbi:hypothetical protein B0H11DRAFT_2294672 [Mycena galericulata]|nr:hypothetical protein B0H11DRAFT_2294672 [Mycena galericulata]
MPELTPASLDEDTTKPHSNHAEFLALPASESSTSSISQYHSALNSPTTFCEPDSYPPVEQERENLISFSPDNLCSLLTHEGPLLPPASPPRPAGSTFSFSIEPKSPEFSSNRHKDRVAFGSISTSVAAHELEQSSSQTPNVYINGLPPHFREDQLFVIAAPFGGVRSVRCFTRHTTRAASGYGFVLFHALAAAENFILTLRRSGIQASLSKVNKPPRAVPTPADLSSYTTAPSAGTSVSLSPFMSAESSSDRASAGTSTSASLSADGDATSSADRERELSFKAKMAALEDNQSTNVYIEGLPMGADRNTLLELVYPYAIHSSRFLRSKLPGPQGQTMIAFMRMETRAAAEDVILRLNGKTVRGWDGSESLVYVRFADTLDQRELRRAEASAREEDSGSGSGSGRLSIAQATLLSYRGKELHESSSNESLVALQSGSSLGRLSMMAEAPAPAPMPIPNNMSMPTLSSNPRLSELLALQAGVLPPPPTQHQNQHHPLPHPLAAGIHDLLAFNAAQSALQMPMPMPMSVPMPMPMPMPMPLSMAFAQAQAQQRIQVREDPLYAPYARQQPTIPMPMQIPIESRGMQGQMPMPIHPNVAALFGSVEMAARMGNGMGMGYLPNFNPNQGPNQFNSSNPNPNPTHATANNPNLTPIRNVSGNGNANGGARGFEGQRMGTETVAERFVMQAQAELQGMRRGGADAVQAPGPPTTVLTAKVPLNKTNPTNPNPNPAPNPAPKPNACAYTNPRLEKYLVPLGRQPQKHRRTSSPSASPSLNANAKPPRQHPTPNPTLPGQNPNTLRLNPNANLTLNPNVPPQPRLVPAPAPASGPAPTKAKAPGMQIWRNPLGPHPPAGYVAPTPAPAPVSAQQRPGMAPIPQMSTAQPPPRTQDGNNNPAGLGGLGPRDGDANFESESEFHSHFTTVHARAATAPAVARRERGVLNWIDNVVPRGPPPRERRRRERTNTNTKGDPIVKVEVDLELDHGTGTRTEGNKIADMKMHGGDAMNTNTCTNATSTDTDKNATNTNRNTNHNYRHTATFPAHLQPRSRPQPASASTEQGAARDANPKANVVRFT